MLETEAKLQSMAVLDSDDEEEEKEGDSDDE